MSKINKVIKKNAVKFAEMSYIECFLLGCVNGLILWGVSCLVRVWG